MKLQLTNFSLCLALLCYQVYAAEPITNSIGMKLVPITPGSFVMGQDGPTSDYFFTKHPEETKLADFDERPAHKVTISQAFHLGATEVTVGQYRQFQPKHQKRAAEDEAMTEVSWHEATAFCAWLSKKEGRPYRLPTEAEWEYACRAGTMTLFSSGDALPAGSQKWFREDNWRPLFFPEAKAMPPEYRVIKEAPSLQVAQTPPNAWGLHDMHGNVAEWCLDWHGPYEAGEQKDPLGRSDGDFRVFRGGAHSLLSYMRRSANRSAWIPESRSLTTGFRVVLGELPKGKTLPPAAAPLNAQHVSQSVPKIEAQAENVPFFSGPKEFVKMPLDCYGPLYSWHNHSPAVVECPNGDLLATWFSCTMEIGTELCNVASRLRFGSTEWEQASPFFDGPDVNDHGPKLCWDGDKTLFHFARGYAENIVRTSTDNGATWSKPRPIFPQGEVGNQIIRLRDGTLATSHDSRTTSLIFSKDGGQTWQWNQLAKPERDQRPGGTYARYPGIHAPLIELVDGRLMAFSRNDPLPDQERFGFKLALSYTRDLGKSWQVEASEFPAVTSGQRPVMLRLKEGPILLCSFTDQGLNWKKRQGLDFKAADGSTFKGYGLFAAVSFDEGKTWPVRRLITPGGPQRAVPGTDGRGLFNLSPTMAEPGGYLTATQTRDGRIQLLSSRNHYVFNLAWLKELPTVVKK
jgi:sulfatase modifying factor 1